MRDVQAFCLNETRAGIPAICHEEVISGLAARTATTYPQQIAVASSWDAPLLERKCRETSEAMRAVGATFALSPMADVIVNSNWTRLEEGYGESGYLSAVMGTAFVRGLQASGTAAACTKHFLGYGTIGGGEQRGWRDIFEEVVYPHEAMINVGGAAAVMTSYDQFKGEQAVSSPTRTDKIELDRPDWRTTALDLAREGVVLLKNDGVLPLRDETKRIALVGPNANSASAESATA